MKAARIARSAAATTAAARGEIAEVRRVNVAVANAPAGPMANAVAGLPAQRKAAKIAAIAPGTNDLDAVAVHVISAINARDRKSVG